MKPSFEQDSDLIRRAQSGEKAAYGLLVQSYMQPAYYSALALVGSHDDALDLSQQAFIRTWKAISRFEAGKKFFTWYYRILRNLCLNRLRDRSRHARTFSDFDNVIDIADEASDPSALLEREQLRSEVRSALGKLRPEEREIIVMKEFDDYSYMEISELLECPIGTVMSRLYYARKHLKELLEDLL